MLLHKSEILGVQQTADESATIHMSSENKESLTSRKFALM